MDFFKKRIHNRFRHWTQSHAHTNQQAEEVFKYASLSKLFLEITSVDKVKETLALNENIFKLRTQMDSSLMPSEDDFTI